MKNLLFEMYVNNQLKYEKVATKDTTEESTQLGTKETTELDDGEDNSESASTLEEISQISEFSTVTKSDSTIIAGKELDIFGTLPDDDIISTAIKTNLMGLSDDIIKNIKQVIWDLHHKKTDPTPDPTPDPDPTPTPDPDPTPTPTPDPPQSEDGTDGKGPDTQLNSVKTLSRGDAAWTSTFNSTEQVLTLKNPFGGANYQYKISSTNGSNVSATFEFLNNGRLVVTGDYLKIEACDNQYDDLIILGNNNNISTGNGSDIVRVGLAIDGYIEENYLKNGSGSYLQTNNGKKIYLASGNTVNTGSGDDYITMLSYDYNVDMGEGDDKFLVPYLDQIISQNVKNTEMQRLLTSKGYLDGIDGWTNQGTEGDCRLLAIINSFCANNNKGDLTDIIQITKNGSNYDVTFPKYTYGNNQISISVSEVNTYTGATGDLDTVILDIALNKIIARNKDFGDTNVEDATYNTLARYLTGSQDVTFVGDNSINTLTDLWNKYKSGEIDNIGIGIANNNYKEGICGGHAYSLKDVNTSEGYVVLINPWDDADVLKLTFEALQEVNFFVQVYGVDIYNQNLLWPNGKAPRPLNSEAQNLNLEQYSSMSIVKLNSEAATLTSTEVTEIIPAMAKEENLIKNSIYTEKQKFEISA